MTSSKEDRRAVRVLDGPTGVARMTWPDQPSRRILAAARAVAPVATPSSTTTTVRAVRCGGPSVPPSRDRDTTPWRTQDQGAGGSERARRIAKPVGDQDSQLEPGIGAVSKHPSSLRPNPVLLSRRTGEGAVPLPPEASVRLDLLDIRPPSEARPSCGPPRRCGGRQRSCRTARADRPLTTPGHRPQGIRLARPHS